MLCSIIVEHITNVTLYCNYIIMFIIVVIGRCSYSISKIIYKNQYNYYSAIGIHNIGYPTDQIMLTKVNCKLSVYA